ncbi:sialic acid-binding Ig-like lectin 11 isoform X1 [Alligator mississippiensis]|uniref:sialic acid-binding Ig-like lectin 11 isoform X1 n=2 Tax=Alligator mississippiensis TaxID=8496 RepID=UPI0028774F2E|nr:sialic acid-binding Ig-like lectin 11 isoform X1 [Alligator mississippiensis]XP_059581629.1 sialic acid-binding Ig-like lectin 11 isoform X1 [Alligator mississippiensis]
MRHEAENWGLHGGAEAPACPTAMLRVLILILLWRDSLSSPYALSRTSGHMLRIQSKVRGLRGLCVHIPCSYEVPEHFPCGSSYSTCDLSWYKAPITPGSGPPVATTNHHLPVAEDARGRFQLLTNDYRKCHLRINEAHFEDTGTYYLYMDYKDFYYKYHHYSWSWHTGVELIVLEMMEPEIWTISSEGVSDRVLAGQEVTVTCWASMPCPFVSMRFTWLGYHGPTESVSSSDFDGHSEEYSRIRLTPTAGQQDTQLTCSITSEMGWKTQKSIWLQVVYPPEPPRINGTLTRDSQEEPVVGSADGEPLALLTRAGDALSLACWAESNPPATLHWTRGNGTLGAPGHGGPTHLELPNLGAGDAGEYWCQAKNIYGAASRIVQVTVHSETTSGAAGGGSRLSSELSCPLAILATCFLLGS